jgi:RHS repeat-associated protein
MDTTMTLSLEYHNNKGGITVKSDVGELHYDIASNPYAVSSIDPSTGLIQSPDSITWTSFEKVRIISENGDSAYFVYDSDNERARMIIRHNDSTVLVRWYPSDNYIKEISGDNTREYTFIGGDAYTANVVAITQNNTTIYYNLLRDHLGNITHVVKSENNNLVAEYSYDAWGRMRNPSTWENFPPDSVPELFVAGRGFTGHEHLPWFNLINMNGRLYDPLIGQFLSPDNYIQNPSTSQAYNRFAYCLNNPLIYTDPSGENPLWFIYLLGQAMLSTADNLVNKHMSFGDALNYSYFSYTYTGTFNQPKYNISSYSYSYSISGDAVSYNYLDNLELPSFSNLVNGFSSDIENKYRALVYIGFWKPAVEYLISSYDLDASVKGLYEIDIKQNGLTSATIEGPFYKMQTIYFGSGVFTRNLSISFGSLVRQVYHELIHVFQKFYLTNPDYIHHELREMEATYKTLTANWLPMPDQGTKNSWINYGIRHFNEFYWNLQLQLKYIDFYYKFTDPDL